VKRHIFIILTSVVFTLSPGFRALLRPPAKTHAPVIIRHRQGSAVTSTNWGGYAVTGANGSVTDVQGSWTVPGVTCASAGSQYSSFWIGIDGYDSNTVEQIGTDSDCQNGHPQYYAWYEFYPHGSFNVPITVNQGDTMQAEVSFSPGTGTFKVTICGTKTNLTCDMKTNGFSISQKMPNAKMSSAEWIAEAPYSGGVLPLSDFGTVNFMNVQATVGKTLNSGLAGFSVNNVFAITMDNPDGATSIPAAYMPSSGTALSNFFITYYPPNP